MNNFKLAKPIPCSKEPNCQGWESIVGKWRAAGWPRRPSSYELKAMSPLIEGINGAPIGIFGATPEYRSILGEKKPDNEVFLFEKSTFSYNGMTKILKEDFSHSPKKEHRIDIDWEYMDFAKNEFSLLMGDIFTGYLQTTKRLDEFLSNSRQMLASGGKFIIRDFVNIPFSANAKDIRHSGQSIDARRWMYILKPKFAIEGNTFYEEKLATNLLEKVGDIKVFKTCANPPRERLILNQSDFEAHLVGAGFDVQTVSQPFNNSAAYPGIWVLTKK